MTMTMTITIILRVRVRIRIRMTIIFLSLVARAMTKLTTTVGSSDPATGTNNVDVKTLRSAPPQALYIMVMMMMIVVCSNLTSRSVG